MPRNDSANGGGKARMAPKVRPAKAIRFINGASPKSAPPKAEVSRKPPGATLPKDKPSSGS